MFQQPLKDDKLLEFTGEMLSADAITRELRRYRYQKPRRVPLNKVAELAGVDTETIARIIRRGYPSERTAARLSPVIKAIMDGALTFKRIGWTVVRYNRKSQDNAPPQYEQVTTLPR